MDIGSVTGGYADSATQDSFCSGGTCTISIIYDQSPMKNDLKPAPAGGAKGAPPTTRPKRHGPQDHAQRPQGLRGS